MRFEASFSAPNLENQFTGRILDDAQIGEASVAGMQVGMAVEFVKVYLNPTFGWVTAPIQYSGTLSYDGRLITGEWHIATHFLQMRGTWEAHRIWQERRSETEQSTEPETLAAHGIQPLITGTSSPSR